MPYYPPNSGSGAVSSVFTRTGAVTAQSGDYTASQVTGALVNSNNLSDVSNLQIASNNIAGSVTSGQYMRGNGTNVVMANIQAADVPALNQNTTGTAANITGTAAIANGGTGQVTQQAAINALAGSATSGQYLRGNGTNVVMSALQAADVPYIGQWAPPDNGLLAATFDINSGTSGASSATAGILYLVKLPLRVSITATYLTIGINTAGTGTSSNSFVGLYSSAGTLLTGSSDISSSLTTAAPLKVTLTTPQSLTAGTFVWCAVLTNLSGTAPVLYGVNTSSPWQIMNSGLTAANYRIAQNGTGLTSLPSSITPSSNQASGTATCRPFWFGVS